MFIYFNENKLAYHKGQLAPFFIAFIIIIIIAALATINIGKVAKTKTYSANAADAGVLAAASTMAAAFNYLAVANSQLRVNYQYFFASATLSFTIGYIRMAMAMAKTSLAIAKLAIACGAKQCCDKCTYPPAAAAACVLQAAACKAAMVALKAATGSLAEFTKSMKSLIVQVSGYWMLQYYFYKMIRENIENYHQGALESGYSFAFSNSGISSKLDDSQREDYKNWLANTIEDVPNESVITYSWLDGQGRSHDVATRVKIDPVNDYVLKHTLLPFPAEIALLGGAIAFASVAKGWLASASAIACFSPCSAIGIAGAALPPEKGGLVTSIVAHGGLAPSGTFTSSSDSDIWLYLITWIDKVPHNRLVDVYQTQRDQGADLGVWSTEYPLTTSSSRASFAGKGQIYPPSPYHDATMILTDFLSSHLLGNLAEPIKDAE